MRGEDIVKELLKRGWSLKSVRGSHHKMENPDTGQFVIIPCHKKDLKIDILQTILKQAGLKE